MSNSDENRTLINEYSEIDYLNEIIDQYKSSVEYDLMRYKLTSDALGIGLWDMDVIDDDPINPNNKFTWSQEFRQMLGFQDEEDFPNLLHSWSDRLHPEDMGRTLDTLEAHLMDRTGQTPYDLTYRLRMKNGDYRDFRAFGTTMRDLAGNPIRVAGGLQDITEKKKQKEAINKSLENMKSILDKSNVMIYVTDIETNEILFISDYMKEHFGIEDDAIGKVCYKVFQDGIDERCDFCPCYQLDKEPDKAVVWEEHNTLTKRYYQNIDRYVDWPDGRKVHIQYSADLTDFKKIQDEIEYRNNLLDAANHMASLLLASDDGASNENLNESMKILVEAVKADRIYIYKNYMQDGKLYCRRLIEWDNILGSMRKNDLFDDGIPYQGNLTRWEKILSSGECINELVREMPEEEQELLSGFETIAMLVVPIFIKNEFWGFVGFDECKEERKFTEGEEAVLRSGSALLANAFLRNAMLADLREQRDKNKAMSHWYQSILDATPLPITVTDADMNWTFVNTAVEKFLGTKSEDMYGKPCSNWNANICGTEDCGIACAKRGLKQTYFSHDGSSYKVDVEILKTEDGETSGYIEVVQDVTEIEEMARRQMEAEAASVAKSTFIANMSHELRTPLNSIVGFCELALDDELPIQTKEYLEQIKKSSGLLLDLINNILDLSKIESGKVELEKIPFDLNRLFAHCQSILLPHAIEKEIELHFHGDPLPGRVVVSDPTKLRQVLINILSNAVKFTKSGRIEASYSLKELTDRYATICFEIKDTGIGMTDEQMLQVFDPFVQADTSTTRKYGGTGLGLSITKEIIELMGGKLFVESTHGVGSKFSFEIPFETAKCSKGEFSPSLNKVIEKPAFVGEVLVCEDNEMNQKVISEHLARVGLHAVIADNGKLGVEAVRERKSSGKKPFDLIFMDMHMPVMDGLEAASKILELTTETPIVAMTANVMDDAKESYAQHGMPDCIGKPFTSQELWACLLSYLKPVGSSAVDEAEQSDTDSKMLRQLKLMFVQDNQNRFNEINEAIKIGDIKLAHRLAHTLKSNAGMIGIPKLQKTAETVEGFLKKLEIPQDDIMTLLETQLTSVLSELDSLQMESAANIIAQERNAEQALALFDQLETMLENLNPESVCLLAELRSLPGTEELARQIEDYDFQPALETLSKLKRELS